MLKELETRKCVVSGDVMPKEMLLRFTVLPDGRLLPDFAKKFGGRGIYVSNSKKLLESMTVKHRLNKVLHRNVVVEASLPQTVESLLAEKGLQALNLARKAGDLVLGFEKVRECVLNGRAAFIVEAIDAGTDGKQKISELAKELEKIAIYDTAALDKTLDRENTVYLAVKKGQTERMVYAALKKYQTFLDM